MATTLTDLWVRPALTAIKEYALDTAEASGLPVRSFVLGEPSERWLEIVPRVVDNFFGAIITKLARSYYIDESTDPGDEGDDSPDQTPRAGWLSTLGEGTFGTTRGGQTFATTTQTIRNDNAYSVTLTPGDLVVRRNNAASDGVFPTYTTTADDSAYPGGSVTILPAASASLPIAADVIGTYSNASTGDINIVVTNSFGSLTVTNPSPALASDREPRALYIDNCKRAPNRVATGGPAALYEYAAFKNADGTPLQRHDGSGAVGINRIFVDAAITTAGAVFVYLADPDGGADGVDIDSADANITGIPKGVITDPIGVVCGVDEYDTRAATEDLIAVTGTAKIKAGSGITAAVVKLAIVAALEAYFKTFPLSGLDVVNTVGGVMYRNDLEAVVKAAYPGIYGVTTTAPSTALVAIGWGHVATYAGIVSNWTVTVT